MNPLIKTRRLVEAVFAARLDDIQCDEAQVLIALSTAEAMPESESRQEYPALWRHLAVCADCAGEYAMTLMLAQLEAAGNLAVPAGVPARPAPNRSTAPEFFGSFAPVIFSASGAAAGQPARGELAMTAAQELALIPERLNLWLDLLPHEGTAGLHDLLCTVAAVDPEEQPLWEGSPAALFLDQVPVLEKVVDDLGDVAFPGLKPGDYTLRLTLAGQPYWIPLHIS
jgi:hypothetical protein